MKIFLKLSPIVFLISFSSLAQTIIKKEVGRQVFQTKPITAPFFHAHTLEEISDEELAEILAKEGSKLNVSHEINEFGEVVKQWYYPDGFGKPSVRLYNGSRFPNFIAKTERGNEINFNEQFGKWVYILFQFQMEGPSYDKYRFMGMDESFKKLNKTHPITPVIFIRFGGANTFFEDIENTIFNIVPDASNFHKKYGVNKMPREILISPDGNIVGHYNYTRKLNIENEIKKWEEDKCKQYWYSLEKNTHNLPEYYKLNVLEKYRTDKSVPTENRKFLMALNSYLEKSQEEKYKTPVFEKPLYPIYELIADKPGVMNYPNNASYEEELRTKIKLSKDAYGGSSTLTQNDTVFNEYTQLFPKIFNVIGTDNVGEGSLKNVGVYLAPCYDRYYHFETVSEVNHPLFGSKYSLEIEYARHKGIEAKLKSALEPDCTSCNYGLEDEIIFAKLKGIPNLYFSYRDTFSTKEQFDYPSRIIYYEHTDGSLIPIWGDSVDLFGCSCM